MNKYLCIFGYETPLQKMNNAAHGWEDEDSAAVFVMASSEQQALQWGRTIAKSFVGRLFGGGGVGGGTRGGGRTIAKYSVGTLGFLTDPDQDTNWDENAFAVWIDNDYANNYSIEQLRAIPTVEYGEYPDIAAMITSKYGNPALATAESNS